MTIEKGDIVRSLCGRDKGRLFYVLSEDEMYYYLADGRLRFADKPKKKKKKHVTFYCKDDNRISGKIKENEYITNAELRRGIAAFESRS